MRWVCHEDAVSSPWGYEGDAVRRGGGGVATEMMNLGARWVCHGEFHYCYIHRAKLCQIYGLLTLNVIDNKEKSNSMRSCNSL
jgi:hypothetical protein